MALVSTKQLLEISSAVFASTSNASTALLTVPEGQVFEGFIYSSNQNSASIQAKIGTNTITFPMYYTSGTFVSYPLYVKGGVGGTTISSGASNYYITITGYLKG